MLLLQDIVTAIIITTVSIPPIEIIMILCMYSFFFAEFFSNFLQFNFQFEQKGYSKMTSQVTIAAYFKRRTLELT